MTNIEAAISILRDKRGQIDVAIRALEAVRDGRDVGAAIGLPKSPADVPHRETGRAEGRSRPAEIARSAADNPSESAAAVPSPAARTGAPPCAVPAAADTAPVIATSRTPEPSWRDWFAHQWHAGVDLGELCKQFKLTFAEIDSLVQELGIVGSPQRRQATREAIAALKATSENKDDPIALWTKTRKVDFAAAYRSGQAEDAIRKAFGLTWEHYYRALEILALRGDRKRADALTVEKAKRPPHNAGKPSVWTPEREADFTRRWEGGDDPEEIARYFKREHDLNLTPGGIAAHASIRGLSGNEKRKAARSSKTAEFQALAARRRLEKSIRQGRTPASALDAPRIPSNPDDIRQIPTESAAPPTGPETLRPDEGPPRADTVVFAAPVNGTAPPSRPAAEPQALQGDREPAGAAGAPTGRPATVLPAPDAKKWPLPKRAFVTAGWKQGQTYEQIAEAATAGGYPMKPKDVIQAVPRLGLTGDPDRRAAMHGGGNA